MQELYFLEYSSAPIKDTKKRLDYQKVYQPLNVAIAAAASKPGASEQHNNTTHVKNAQPAANFTFSYPNSREQPLLLYQC